MNTMQTSEIIKTLRKENKLTQEQLANILSCDRYRVVDIERGKTSASIDDVKRLSQHFNVSTDYLLGVSDVTEKGDTVSELCEYTGLSETAIRVIHDSSADDVALAMIEYLIVNMRQTVDRILKSKE